MKKIELNNAQHFPTLNVEHLGRPIHVIREELQKIFSQADSSITQDLQRWVKDKNLTIKLADIQLSNRDATDQSNNASIIRHQAGGLIEAQLDTQLLLALSDKFYNADIDRSDAGYANSTLTASDLRLQQRLLQRICSLVADEKAWQLTDDGMTYGVGLLATFTVSYRKKVAAFRLYFDENMLQVLMDDMAFQTNHHLSDDFRLALENTPVQLHATLCQKKMPLDDVLKLRPDDVLNIDLLTNVPVRIGQEHLFNGCVADKDGQLVLILKDK
ncbi:FliM/FliN family flagellar motor C-terminal domain-containing protein [Photobacterium sp. WH77]|uniref:FliM/FliN family flagellar motor switch protein n=1 Tax=unclassified Photobacterium TaxID=2628852 RepID=UPI001EDB04B4|nr:MULTISPECIES: FliM/FliN family flagellar motor C-terminal domain-containing protein [unclassified Photobacterium]MCG2836370.1 FliM/FliN family flagellar motor C-terminal domain-containing protein [Photobacterium sp. WH77]MCG2844003.1 FliM/FliN family flagellar motor C-terminal domain-containing protein [Photobacterium sp. WH80]